MIDQEARNKAAELVERLVGCEITNDEFEDNYPPNSQDRALKAIRCWTWMFYTDLREHKLKGKYQPTPEGLESLKRCILFLRSDLQYKWPDVPWSSRSYVLTRVFSLGLLGKKRWKEFEARGEFDVWPFLRTDDYHRARERVTVAGR